MSDEIEVVTEEPEMSSLADQEQEEEKAIEPVEGEDVQGEEAEQGETEPQQEKPKLTEEEGSEPSEEVKPPKKSGAEKRIGKLTFQRREAERKEAEALAKVEELKRKLAEVQKPATDETLSEPQYDDYEEEADYFKALAKFTAENTVREEKEREAKASLESATQEAEQTQKTRQAEDAASFNEVLTKAKEKYSDFESLVINAPDLSISEGMLEIIKQTENPADILYELGKNPSKATEIAQLTPAQAAMQIGRMDVPAATNEVAPKKTTKAPAPIKPVTPTSASGKKSPEDMTMEEYRKWREG